MEEERKQAAAADSGDGGPKTRGRASSSSAAAAAAAAVKATQSPSPSLQDRGAIALLLADAFPARSSEIKLLLGLLGQPCDPLLPTFVYGGPSTGKTSILLEIFNRLGRPFAYASCRSLYSPRILFESVLNQLLGHSRCAGNNFASAKKCDKLSDFVACLPDACDVAISSKNGHTHSKKHRALPEN